MAETYEEIVQKWYVRMRGNFTDMLMDRYRSSDLRLSDAENIYQEIFVAIHRNLREGRIGENWDWRNYIIRVGMNMASKKYREIGRYDSIDETEPDDEDKPSKRLQKISALLEELRVSEEDSGIYGDAEAHALLGDELTHTPEPCASIIRMKYYSDMSDEEIAEELVAYRDNGKSPQVNAKAIKARRWLCMKDLIYRVKMALFNAGIIDEKPEKTKRNG